MLCEVKCVVNLSEGGRGEYVWYGKNLGGVDSVLVSRTVYIYIFLYIYMCVRVCVCERSGK